MTCLKIIEDKGAPVYAKQDRAGMVEEAVNSLLFYGKPGDGFRVELVEMSDEEYDDLGEEQIWTED